MTVTVAAGLASLLSLHAVAVAVAPNSRMGGDGRAGALGSPGVPDDQGLSVVLSGLSVEYCDEVAMCARDALHADVDLVPIRRHL